MSRVSFLFVMLTSLLTASWGWAGEGPRLPSVDLGIQVLDVEVRGLSRRTDGDWWALGSVAGGNPSSIATWTRHVRVLRSTDEGRSWREDPGADSAIQRALSTEPSSHPQLDFLVWFTPEVGIVAGYIGARLLRTTDAGLTWESVPIPDAGWAYDVAHVEGRTWLCGSTGRIVRSDDAGASWRELEGTPFSGEDRCMSMSFLDREHGWAVGLKGSLWETADGGRKWRRLEAPELPLISQGIAGDLRRVVRLSPEVAWLGGTGGPYQTTDGGKTWHTRPGAEDLESGGLHVARTPAGQRIVTVGSAGEKVPLEEWVPLLRNSNELLFEEDTVVKLERTLLRTYVSGRFVRAHPFVSRGTGIFTPLEGVARKSPDAGMGWAGDVVMATVDAGRSWFRRGHFPEHPVRTVVFLKDGTVFAELGSGKLLRSENFGQSWKHSTNVLDAYDFTGVAGRPPGGAPSLAREAEETARTPFGCLLDTTPVVVKVDYDYRHCYGGSDSTLYLRLRQGGADLSGRSDDMEEPIRLSPRQLSRSDGERLVRELIAAATREETPLSCLGSTANYRVSIEWACSDAEETRGRVEFTAPFCGSPPREGTGFEPDEGYARALGIREVAIRALRRALR